MSNQQADMRQHEQEMREAFYKFFKTIEDPHIGIIETTLERNAAWKAWQAATLAAEARIRELGAKIAHELWARKPEYFSEAIVCVNRVVDAALTEHKEQP